MALWTLGFSRRFWTFSALDFRFAPCLLCFFWFVFLCFRFVGVWDFGGCPSGSAWPSFHAARITSPRPSRRPRPPKPQRPGRSTCLGFGRCFFFLFSGFVFFLFFFFLFFWGGGGGGTFFFPGQVLGQIHICPVGPVPKKETLQIKLGKQDALQRSSVRRVASKLFCGFLQHHMRGPKSLEGSCHDWN